MIIISGALSDVLVVVWWLDIVFFHYDKLHMLLKVGAPGRTHNAYSENSCSECIFIMPYSPYSPHLSRCIFFVFCSGLFSGSGGKGQLFDIDVETGSLTHMIKKAHRLDKLSFYL